jgi:hypothetical protein
MVKELLETQDVDNIGPVVKIGHLFSETDSKAT